MASKSTKADDDPSDTKRCKCGATDHLRITAKACPLNKVNTAAAAVFVPIDKEEYVVCCGLKGMFRDEEMEQRFKPLILDDVKVYAQVMTEYSLYVHMMFRKKIAEGDVNYFKTLDFQQFLKILYTVQGKGDVIQYRQRAEAEKRDTRYRQARQQYPEYPDRYDTEHRSYFFQEGVRLFMVNLENNILINFHARVKRFLVKVIKLKRPAAILTRHILNGEEEFRDGEYRHTFDVE